jgi:hypothetical protein
MRRVLAVLVVLAVAVCLSVSASARTLHSTISVSVSGSGNVKSSPSGSGCQPDICPSGAINCPQGRCQTQYKQGTNVTFTEEPTSGQSFLGWGGYCAGSGTNSTCSFTVPSTDTSLSISASFTGSSGGGGGPPPPPPPPSRYTLNVTKSGSGSGSVVSDPAGINCGSTCSMTSDNGQLIRLTATPAPGSVFVGWSGGCTGATCAPTLVSDLTVTAVFDTAAPVPVDYRLSVSKAGDGSGTVTSSTGGISCGATCSATLPAGTAVGLTATPEAGSTFTGWSGACSGTGACSLTLGAAAAVTATFETIKDTAAPRAVAFAASAKRGKKAKLSYFVSDDSGQSSEQIMVYKGRRIIARLAAALHVAKAGTVRTVSWKVPAKTPLGKRRFCVTASDAAGNKSAPTCATLTIKR